MPDFLSRRPLMAEFASKGVANAGLVTVAPLAGAWIEITPSAKQTARGFRRTPRGCVDKIDKGKKPPYY